MTTERQEGARRKLANGINDVRPLRILTESLLMDPSGGIELSTIQSALALADRGHDFLVMYGEDGLLRSRYEDAGLRIEGPVSFDFNVRHPISGMSHLIGPAQSARKWKPDVVWLNRFESIYWARAVATWSRCPIVCHLRHMPYAGGLSALQRTVAHYVAVSRFMRDSWVDAGVAEHRISVINNSLPANAYPHGGMTERSAARRQLGLPANVPIVLFYGRMIEEKGVGTLLDAWAQLSLDPRRPLLLLVGSPPPENVTELDRRLRQLSAETFRWYPMQSDVVPFLHASDLVVFPTLLKEGFGRVTIEGLKTGRPVIASRIGAVPEILSGPMSRFLFEPGNPAALAQQITNLLDWREKEPELETACTSWVAGRFDFTANIAAFEAVLQKHSRR